jgi:hypothetical protein
MLKPNAADDCAIFRGAVYVRTRAAISQENFRQIVGPRKVGNGCNKAVRATLEIEIRAGAPVL